MVWPIIAQGAGLVIAAIVFTVVGYFAYLFLDIGMVGLNKLLRRRK